MAETVRYARLPTEQTHPRTRNLDQLTPEQIAARMSREDAAAVRAVGRAKRAIAQAIRLISSRLQDNGRLFFLGAGTSGRLGVIEAAECPPTFSTPPSLVQAIIAGGKGAVFRSREGAEDDRTSAGQLIRRRVRSQDVVVGITASGVTPFVEAGLQAATKLGAATVLVSCHPQSPIAADARILLSTGPEVLAGSTRLKAGTATKLVLNQLTLGSMAALGKTYGNWMVDVRPSSRKLRARAERLVEMLANCPQPEAKKWLTRAHGSVKPAVVMARRNASFAQARRMLRRAQGSLRAALE
jgi:N-acetylmuramic acid 6-phosphate etherase